MDTAAEESRRTIQSAREMWEDSTLVVLVLLAMNGGCGLVVHVTQYKNVRVHQTIHK